ncbi:hypothetical protein [Granulicella tundricola]|uniref:Uncharacterized protein n=1 Tax=Granulicella tundricola (strain ATCC BAA-1859 / DSM 23138 / MP5ACTX9) TaxID=1198114 RepID=E8X555_GRATM|nr:hypothetical protein [Granulicella tundricola]ADW68319.1 hypothetical protein AciX9_1257 [Granulicella tundricola MP5ACTX9]
MASALPVIFNPRRKSLIRANALVLISFLIAVRLSRFPENHATLWLVLPVLIACVGTADTIRNMQPRWSFYHGGVVLCIYMDLMALAMMLFFLFYPYALWLSSSR